MFLYESEMLCTFLSRDSNVFLIHVSSTTTTKDFSVKEREKRYWYLVSYGHVFELKCGKVMLLLRLKDLVYLLENNIWKIL